MPPQKELDQMTATSDPRRSVAFHEAAHAVATIRNGDVCGGVTIVPRNEVLGEARAEDWFDRDDDSRGAVLVGLLAGYAAELALGREEAPARARACSDFEKAHEIMRALGQIDEAAWVEKARGFVAENWAAIELVAIDLLKYGAVDGQLLEVIVDVADGETTPDELERCRRMFRGQ